MPNLPSGTVTFLFSDIEGSTALLKQLGDDAYAELLRRHREIVRVTFAAHDGQEIDTQGDAFFYSFPRARRAVAAAVEVQRTHAAEAWPLGIELRVRIGLHTGEPAVGEEGYTGIDVVRAARIAAVGSGGQILMSEATRALVGGDLPDGVAIAALGERRLKDIDRPEPLHEVRIAGITSQPPRAPEAGQVAISDPAVDPQGAVADAFSRLPDWVRRAAGPILPAATRARESIEDRVLREIERAMAADPDLGPSRANEPAASGSVADEITRLQALRDAGALTEDQYARAVDRVVGAEDR
ncbi:MAG: adenylate/guanylate cyclase domain-containing protein [Chloroflexota bacterium]